MSQCSVGRENGKSREHLLSSYVSIVRVGNDSYAIKLDTVMIATSKQYVGGELATKKSNVRVHLIATVLRLRSMFAQW